jgi:hypothetical protein
VLRRHVTCGSDDHPNRGIRFGDGDLVRTRARNLGQFGQSKIKDLYTSVFRDKNILRLQIAVNYPFFVRCRHSLRNLYPVFDCLSLRHRPAVQHGAQALAFQEFGN